MLVLPNRRQAQPHRQINPLRVFGIDEVDFPRSMPVFQLFLARDSSLHRAENFEMHQPVNRIFGCVAWRKMTAMLRQSLEQVGRYADVKRAVMSARKNIYARLLFMSHRQAIAAKWTLKQVQGDETGDTRVELASKRISR